MNRRNPGLASPVATVGRSLSSRREVLRAMGLTCAAAALARPAWSDAAPPRRLIVVSSTHGAVHSGWRTNPAGLPDEVPWSQDLLGAPIEAFGAALRPLHAHRDRLLVLDGVSMLSAELDLSGFRHEKGWIHAWTGGFATFTGTAVAATAPSLDQLVARRVARPDRLPSLELSVRGGRPICHGGPGQQLPLEHDPARAFARVFGGSDDPLAAERGSVLDWVRGESASLARKLSADDRAKLEAHTELVRQLELRLAGLASAGCGAPVLPEAHDHRTTFRAHAELVAASFACDLTRVATLSLGDVPSAEFGWGGVGSGDAHNDFAHLVHDAPQAAAAMTDYHAFQAAEIAGLVELLSSIPEGGGSVMDHTLIVWGNELGDGWHGYHRYCPVLIGGGWAFRTGRVVHWPWDETPSPMVVPGGRTDGAGVPHQRVLVSVARAMGLDLDHVGLASIHDRSGAALDLRHALQELS